MDVNEIDMSIFKTIHELIVHINECSDYPAHYAAAFAIDAAKDNDNLTMDELSAHLDILADDLGAVFDHEEALDLALEAIGE